MYAGFIVDTAPVMDIFKNPTHRYTSSLLRALPSMDKRHADRLESIDGLPPHFANLKPGCPFAPRCDLPIEKCSVENPGLVEISSNHDSACWNPVTVSTKGKDTEDKS